LPQKFIETKVFSESINLIINYFLVAERSVRFISLFIKINKNIRSEHTGISSLKQCKLIIVVKNLRFSIQQ